MFAINVMKIVTYGVKDSFFNISSKSHIFPIATKPKFQLLHFGKQFRKKNSFFSKLFQ